LQRKVFFFVFLHQLEPCALEGTFRRRLLPSSEHVDCISVGKKLVQRLRHTHAMQLARGISGIELPKLISLKSLSSGL
jgi:hypothetical protein